MNKRNLVINFWINNLEEKMLKKIECLIISVLTLVCIMSCGQKNETSKEEDTVVSVYAVQGGKTKVSNLDDYLEFGGDVSAISNVDILPEASGKLATLHVAVGDNVSKNQLIAEVDPSRPGMNYTFSPVKAPVAGTITSLPVSVGSTVSPALSLGKISSTNKLEVVINVAERFVSRVKLNQNAVLVFDAYPGATFSATVSKVSPVLDTSTRTMSVTLNLNQSDSRIKAGMYAKVKLITNHKNKVVVIPSTALVSRNGENFVFVVKKNDKDEDIALKKSVEAGIRVDDKQEIISGLGSDEIVITKGMSLLSDGSRVNLVALMGGDN